MTTILLVEDHLLLAENLARHLQERGQMAMWATVHSAEAALAQLAAAQAEEGAEEERPLPDLALIDISLPQMNGFQLIAKLAEQYPDLPCVALSAHHSVPYVRQALDNGARGYVAKGDLPAIVEAIHRVLQGDIYLSQELRGLFLK